MINNQILLLSREVMSVVQSTLWLIFEIVAMAENNKVVLLHLRMHPENLRDIRN